MAQRELILHDLSDSECHDFLPDAQPNLTIFPALPKVNHCQGCFGCWVKSPGRCVIKDRGSDFAPLLAKHDLVTVISRLVFGGFSGPVKAIIDRSIAFILPFFEYRNGQMFHTRRYPTSPSFRYFFHGQNFGSNLLTAKKLAQANQLNFMSPCCSVDYFSNLADLKAALTQEPTLASPELQPSQPSA
ncbi:MAG: flavodoxin family protein [Deltaproteobacteria bacterium]|jgi:multimeric flavodoxin WrbA|nr:flavodoxin family protein [Deltaproteobacteria bacterium]